MPRVEEPTVLSFEDEDESHHIDLTVLTSRSGLEDHIGPTILRSSGFEDQDESHHIDLTVLTSRSGLEDHIDPTSSGFEDEDESHIDQTVLRSRSGRETRWRCQMVGAGGKMA